MKTDISRRIAAAFAERRIMYALVGEIWFNANPCPELFQEDLLAAQKTD